MGSWGCHWIKVLTFKSLCQLANKKNVGKLAGSIGFNTVISFLIIHVIKWNNTSWNKKVSLENLKKMRILKYRWQTVVQLLSPP